MLDALSWALTAAAVLLVLYALRVVVQDRDPEKPGKQAGLGCGFFFMACLLWSLASHRWVGGWLDAFRLGMGIFLVTPAIGALTKPHGARLFLGVIGLILGVVLAGPVARDLVLGIQEARDNAPRQELEDNLESLRRTEGVLTEAIDQWDADRLRLKATLQAAGHADFAALQADPDAAAALVRLAEIDDLYSLAVERLAQVKSRMRQIDAALAQETEDDSNAELLEALGLGETGVPSADDLTPVEEYTRQKRLEAMFEDLGK